MGLFGRGPKRPELPSDIVSIMERYGRYEFNPQTGAFSPQLEGQLMGDLYPFASADPDRFLTALADAVLPVGGWAVYGASRLNWELLSSSPEGRQHPLYKAILSAALEFLGTQGVSIGMLRGYEREHLLATGGTMNTWKP